MNYRAIDRYRREAHRHAPVIVKGRNGPGLEIRRRTTGYLGEPTREETDAVLIGDELWSVLNRMPRAQAAILERVYLLNGSVACEGRMRVHRARLSARMAAGA